MNYALQYKALKYRIFGIQMLITLLLTGGAWFYQGLYASLSLSLGGLIGIVPSFVFASFYPSQVKMRAQSVLKRLYWGETVKLLVTALLFLLAFQWPDLQVLYLFISFIIMQFVSIIVSSRAS